MNNATTEEVVVADLRAVVIEVVVVLEGEEENVGSFIILNLTTPSLVVLFDSLFSC